MFDELLDDDPYLKERDRRVAEKAATQASIQILQKVVVDIVRHRYPTLIALAEQRVNKITSTEVLQELIEMIASASDENVVHFILHPKKV